MINYLIGKVTFSDLDIVEFESHASGYRFDVICPISKDVDKIYLHELKNDYTIKVFAFEEEFDRDVFVSLLKLKGVGEKTIKRLYTKYSSSEIQKIVRTKDVNKLLVVSGIGPISAKNIIGSISNNKNSLLFKEVYQALKTFGYNEKDLQNLSTMINNDLDVKKNIEIIIKKL